MAGGFGIDICFVIFVMTFTLLPLLSMLAVVVLRHRIRRWMPLLLVVLVAVTPIAGGALMGNRWLDWKLTDDRQRSAIDNCVKRGAVIISGRLDVGDEISWVGLEFPADPRESGREPAIGFHPLFPLEFRFRDHLGGGVFVAGISGFSAVACWLVFQRVAIGRIRRGLCPRCRYPVSAGSACCTECGSVTGAA